MKVCQIIKTIINASNDDNTKLHSKIEDPEMKLHETELAFNRLDQYNRRNNIEIQGIPSNVADEAIEDVTDLVKLANPKNNCLFCE